MTDNAPLLFVDIQQSKSRWPVKRPQRWYWVLKSADNNEPLAVSSENYTNKQDCIDAAFLVHSAGSTVYFRQSEHGNVLMRQAITE